MISVDEVNLSLERFRIIKQTSSHKRLPTLKPMSRHGKGRTTLDLKAMTLTTTSIKPREAHQASCDTSTFYQGDKDYI